jgi:hypothetical protein
LQARPQDIIDNPAPEPTGQSQDWGSDLQVEAIQYGVPEPLWLPILGQPGFLRAGFVHLLAASAKVGKTELLLQSIAQWNHVREVVYYFTEEYRDLWMERLAGAYALRGETFEHVKFFYLPRIPLEQRAAYIRDRVSDRIPTVIVVDTVRSGLNIQDEADNPAIRKVMEPITAAAHAHNKTVLLVHHTSKARANSSTLEASAGGLDFLGAVDAVLTLTRLSRRPTSDTHRKLIGAGRMRFGGELVYHWPDKDGPLVPTSEAGDDLPPGLSLAEWKTTAEIGGSITVADLRKLVLAGRAECNMQLDDIDRGSRPKWRAIEELELE